MSNRNSIVELDFVRQAALFIAKSKSLSIEDALSFVYNSETFRMLDENGLEGKSLEQLLDIFKKEMVLGKIQ